MEYYYLKKKNKKKKYDEIKINNKKYKPVK
jgi:hypothetical protein